MIDFESRSSYTVTLTVTDSARNTCSEQYVIGVQDVPESTHPPIIGTAAAESLSGTNGDDEIWGRAGNDTLSGLAGNDKLYREGGNDWLDGGLGADEMAGAKAQTLTWWTILATRSSSSRARAWIRCAPRFPAIAWHRGERRYRKN